MQVFFIFIFEKKSWILKPKHNSKQKCSNTTTSKQPQQQYTQDPNSYLKTTPKNS